MLKAGVVQRKIMILQGIKNENPQLADSFVQLTHCVIKHGNSRKPIIPLAGGNM